MQRWFRAFAVVGNTLKFQPILFDLRVLLHYCSITHREKFVCIKSDDSRRTLLCVRTIRIGTIILFFTPLKQNGETYNYKIKLWFFHFSFLDIDYKNLSCGTQYDVCCSLQCLNTGHKIHSELRSTLNCLFILNAIASDPSSFMLIHIS